MSKQKPKKLYTYNEAVAFIGQKMEENPGCGIVVHFGTCEVLLISSDKNELDRKYGEATKGARYSDVITIHPPRPEGESFCPHTFPCGPEKPPREETECRLPIETIEFPKK